MSRPSSLPYVWMLAGSLAFAIMGALAHAAGSECPWQVVALSRCLLVLVIVGGVALASGTRLVLWKPRTLWLRSIAGSLSLVGTFYAFARLHVSTVLALTNTFPVWVAVLSWPMLGVVPSFRVWVAVLAGVSGVYLLQQPHGDAEGLALVVALGCSLSTAVAMLGLHRLQDVDSYAVVVHFSGVATMFCLASFLVFPFAEWPTPFDNWTAPALLLGVGVTASVGQILLTKAFTAGEPARVSVVSLTQVVFALGFDLYLGHPVTAASLAGIALIIAPTGWVMRRGG